MFFPQEAGADDGTVCLQRSTPKTRRQVIVSSHLNPSHVSWYLFCRLDGCFVNKLPFLPISNLNSLTFWRKHPESLWYSVAIAEGNINTWHIVTFVICFTSKSIWAQKPDSWNRVYVKWCGFFSFAFSFFFSFFFYYYLCSVWESIG